MSYKWAFLAMFIIMMPVALASTPDFGIEDTFQNSLINGNNDVGSLIFTAKQYHSEAVLFSEVENYQFQQYDIVTWNGSSSINITSPSLKHKTLTQGMGQYIDEVGIYQFYPLYNVSDIGTVVVAPADENRVIIDKINLPSGFNLTFSKTNFVLNNEEIISVKIGVDDDVETGIYEVGFDVNNVTKKYNFEVLENLNWEIINGSVEENYTVHSGENVYAGSILLENTGNKNVEITVNKIGDDKHLFIIPQRQTLYKKSQLLIEFSIQVPLSQTPGISEITVNVAGGTNNVSKKINISVIDSVMPIIQTINFSTDKAFSDNLIAVIAVDNNDVENVTLQYDDKKITLDKDEQLFTTTVSFNKLSRYILKFCATDYAQNTKCVEVNKTFKQTNLFTDFDNNIKMPSKKVSQYSRVNLFNITEMPSEGIDVILSEFVATTDMKFNDSYIIRIVDGDGSVKSFDKYDGTITLKKKGQIFLEVRSSEVGDYSGILTFDLPEYADEVSDIKFEISFKEYDVPESFVRPWNHDTEISCRVIDTGDLDSTHYECTFDAPISIRPDDISIPTTIAERMAFENKTSVIQQELDLSHRRAGVIITFLVTIIIIVSLTSYYYIEHYPYVRVTKGHKSTRTYNEQGDSKYGN